MRAWVLMHKHRLTNSLNDVCKPDEPLASIHNIDITESHTFLHNFTITNPKAYKQNCRNGIPNEWVEVEVTFPCTHKAVCKECGVNL